ncbi:putative lipoprotein [Pseudoalteromonas phage J2-1_QLiu-2017]|nr:putative lipoprotein [Pseudoalteromonas phage J2-1_QLiu-2017]
MKKLLATTMIILGSTAMSGCMSDAAKASNNISKASDNFEVDRRIHFYDGINAKFMLTIEGKCSIDPDSLKIAVTCKVAPNEYEKHYLGLSDNVTYFAQQLKTIDVSTYHTRIILKPESVLPDFDLQFQTDTDAKGR